jgi:hypothetical protein
MVRIETASPRLEPIAFSAVIAARMGPQEGNIAMIRTIHGVPVKTRIPLTGWVFAGIFTLLSLSSSLVHLAADDVHVSTLSSKLAATAAHHASLAW